MRKIKIDQYNTKIQEFEIAIDKYVDVLKASLQKQSLFMRGEFGEELEVTHIEAGQMLEIFKVSLYVLWADLLEDGIYLTSEAELDIDIENSNGDFSQFDEFFKEYLYDVFDLIV